MLRVIDISVYKRDINLAAVDFDAVIDKATGGNGYVNPDCDNKIQAAIALNKKWGFFHYYGDGYGDNNPIEEADFFVNNCQGYFNKGYALLDWERGGNAQVNDPNAALAFLQHVEARTGVKMGIYMSLSLITSMNWSAVIAAGYSLWCADYIENNTPISNWAMDAKRDPNPHWDGVVNDVMWQFTSTGQLSGYGGNLDLSFFYGSAASWDAYAQTHAAQPAPAPAPAPAPDPTTTTTTEAPAPDPTTTTTTEAPAPVDPDPETTTTTTTEMEQEPSPTTTTTSTESGTTTTTTVSTFEPYLTPVERIVQFISGILKGLFRRK